MMSETTDTFTDAEGRRYIAGQRVPEAVWQRFQQVLNHETYLMEQALKKPHRGTALREVVREALMPRLVRVIPDGEPNAGSEEWEQPGADEVASAVAIWLAERLSQAGADRA